MAKWIEDKKFIVEWIDPNPVSPFTYEFNVMKFAKEVCLKTDWTKIAQETESFAKVEGIRIRSSRLNWGAMKQNMDFLWNSTETQGKKGNIKAGTKNIVRINNRLNYWDAVGGVAFPANQRLSGVVVDVLAGMVSYAYKSVFGKEGYFGTPWNYMFLLVASKYLKFGKREVNPYKHGSRKWDNLRFIEKKSKEALQDYDKIPPKIKKFLKRKAVSADEQKKIEERMIAGYRRTLESVKEHLYYSEQLLEQTFNEMGVLHADHPLVRSGLLMPTENKDVVSYAVALIDSVKEKMSLNHLNNNEVEVLEYIITERPVDDMEPRNWDTSESALLKREKRLVEVWKYLLNQ